MSLISMAVEASHREMIYQGELSRYDDRFQTTYGSKMEEILPMYGYEMTDLFPTNVFKEESDVTLTSSLPFSRKRLHDSSSFNPPLFVNQNQQQFGALKFLDEDISSQIYQQQLEIDRFVAHHTEQVRSDIKEIRRRNSIRLAAAYEQIKNILKTKEDEILKIVQLNRSLVEKVKSITVENQIWRELAQTNEATANALRDNIQQVLSEIYQQQQQQQQQQNCLESYANADAESHSGSNFNEDYSGGERKVNNEIQYCNKSGTSNNMWCRKCGKEESCVLLLPCRHLCVCSMCVSTINNCPVCNSVKSAGIHVLT